MDNSRKPRPVLITRIVDGIVKIDDDALSGILKRPEFGDHPIAIISIAGVLRSGKSFLLNFLLRYLRQKGWSNPDWMGDDTTKADDGIKWRGGKDPETTGIIVWDEIFELRRTNGEKILLLLMDTQGLFDNDTTKQNNVKLFTLTTLASSVQILNIKDLIQERDLENLQLCVEFALVSARQAGPSFKLQTLMVLVRDWVNEDENPYGFEGGQQYLDEVLGYRDNKEELNSVRKHLKESFKNLKCFLMPHPGLRVQKTAKFEGTNQEIDQDFLDQLRCFVPTLLHPDSIVCKEVAPGNRLTAGSLLHIIASADKAFVDNKIPKVENLLAAQTKAHFSSVYEKAVQEYDRILEGELKKCKEILTEEQLKRCGQTALQTALNEFNSAIRIGSDDIRNRYLRNLEITCGEHFKTCEEANKNKLAKVENQLQTNAILQLRKYQRAMKKEIGLKPVDEAKLQQIHQKQSEAALSEFKSMEEAEFGSIFNRYRDDLLGNIEEHFQDVVETNSERIAASNAEKRVRELLQKVDQYADEHEEVLTQYLRKCPKIEELERYSLEEGRRLENEFTREASDASEEYIGKLEGKFAKNYRSAKSQNQANLDTFKRSVQCTIAEKVVEYKQYMQEEMAGAHISESALREHHQAISQGMRSSIRNLELPPHMIKEAKAIMKEKMEGAFEEMERINEKNKEDRDVYISKIGGVEEFGKNIAEFGEQSHMLFVSKLGRAIQFFGKLFHI